MSKIKFIFNPYNNHLVNGFIKIFIAFVLFTSSKTLAAELDFEIKATEWHTPGDGRTLTTLQYQDIARYSSKPVQHIANTTTKGELTYGFPITIPPAILKPSLSINYASSAGWNIEMTNGWSIGGIMEIRRPHARAFSEGKDAEGIYDDELLLSGELSGTLLPSGNDDYRYYLKSSSQLLVAQYDSNTDIWQVESGGKTWTLKPNDRGAKTAYGTSWWRVTETRDGSGNTIKYTYHDDGRIKTVTYGGNDKVNAPHLVAVNFIYAENTSTRTSARGGFITKYAFHLDQIIISSNVVNEDAQTTENWLVYDFVYTQKDKLDLLTTIEREGPDEALVETVAKFTYSEFDPEKSPAITSQKMVPSSLDKTYSTSRGDKTASTSGTINTLADFNGDGLPDNIDGWTSQHDQFHWWVSGQAVDQASRNFSWNTTQQVTAKRSSIDMFIHKSISDSYNGSAASQIHNLRQSIDIDGDGYLDIVELENPDVTTVFYGNGTSIDESIAEEPGIGPIISYAVRADHYQAADWHKDAETGLLDFNGDGRLDFYDPESGKVYLKNKKRGKGWDQIIELKNRFNEFRTVKYTIVKEEAQIDFYDSCFDTCHDDCYLNATEDEFSDDSESYDSSNCPYDSQEECEDECYSHDADYYTDCTEYDCEDACSTDYNECLNCRNDCEDNCISDCNDNCSPDIMEGEDPDYSDESGSCDSCDECCEEECKDAVENNPRESRIAYTDETRGFYDINGDGLPDHVNASSTPWQVHLNNGHDFEPAVEWVAPYPYIRRVYEGHPNVELKISGASNEKINGEPGYVFQTLIDVDGDKLPDLALGKNLGRIWYKNTGSGFGSQARPLPVWWPDYFTVTSSQSSVDASNGDSQSFNSTDSTILDLNHDGIMDVINKTEVVYGPYPKPYILKKIDNGQGGKTEIGYRSLATIYPSGQFKITQKTPGIRDVVDMITSTDEISSQTGSSNYNYSNGTEIDGIFRGFEKYEIVEKLNSAWFSKSSFKFELSRDLPPLALSQTLFTDGNLGFAPSLKRGNKKEVARYKIENTYMNKGEANSLRLLQTRKITEQGESSGKKSFSLAYQWDSGGNMTSFKHDGGGNKEDAYEVLLTYTSNGATDGNAATYYVPASRTVSGTDPLTGEYRRFSHDIFYYDGNSQSNTAITAGLPTKLEQWSGWKDGGENLEDKKLTVKITRGSRGEIIKAHDIATGIFIEQKWGFGAAILEEQKNALGHKLLNTLDEQGRLLSQTDSNGLTVKFEYDAFGRIKSKSTATKSGGHYKIEDFEYKRSAKPYYTAHTLYNANGSIAEMEYSLESGFGKSVQDWSQHADGKFVVSGSINDLTGAKLKTSHPQITTSFKTDAVGFNFKNIYGNYWHDPLGVPRETIRDAAIKSGSQLVYFDEPRQEIRVDEEGFKTKLSYDAHNRLIQVEQGKLSNFATTAKYRYDPLDRLVRFEDGKGTVYTYSYDGAGNLRQSTISLENFGVDLVDPTNTGLTFGTRTTASTNFVAQKIWYSFEYKGTLRTLAKDAAGGTAQWTYDAIGRPLTLSVSDSLPSAPGSIEYKWNYDSEWIGKLASVTDPTGTTNYKYSPLGRVEKSERSYNDADRTKAAFSFDYDLKGRVIEKTFPSGKSLTSEYKYGQLTSQNLLNDNEAAIYGINFDYNNWGLLSSAKTTTGHKFINAFSTPIQIDSLSVEAGGVNYNRNFSWFKNGLLKSRLQTVTPETGVPEPEVAITYDTLKQLTGLTKSGTTLESFNYDTAGNLKTMKDASGVNWTYALSDAGNRMEKRVSDAGVTETFSYDDAGRIKIWKSADGTREYYYDGLGRLRGSTFNGAWQQILHYDATGALIKRDDNNPFTATPESVFSFLDWRHDTKAKATTEFHTAYSANENGSVVWLARDFDGGVVSTFANDGSKISGRSFGAYGSILNVTGSPWNWNSFHGSEDQGEVIHMGQRHMIQGMGQWLQSEPLLYSGPDPKMLADPLALSPYRYARNAPTVFKDATGQNPFLLGPALNDPKAFNQDPVFATVDYYTSPITYIRGFAAEVTAGLVARAWASGKITEFIADECGATPGLDGYARMIRDALPRYNGPKPTYMINPQHVKGHPNYNPNKDPLPSDAEQVYKRAVPDNPDQPTVWFAKNKDGVIYRFSQNNKKTTATEAHFSGLIDSDVDKRNLTEYAIDRMDGK